MFVLDTDILTLLFAGHVRVARHDIALFKMLDEGEKAFDAKQIALADEPDHITGTKSVSAC